MYGMDAPPNQDGQDLDANEVATYHSTIAIPVYVQALITGNQQAFEILINQASKFAD
jgi:hypothetical protein